MTGAKRPARETYQSLVAAQGTPDAVRLAAQPLERTREAATRVTWSNRATWR